MTTDNELLVCTCGDVSHQLVVTKWEDSDDGSRELFVGVHLNKVPWWARLANAINYIFGKESIYGDFEEVILTKEHLPQLKKIVEFLENEQLKERKE